MPVHTRRMSRQGEARSSAASRLRASLSPPASLTGDVGSLSGNETIQSRSNSSLGAASVINRGSAEFLAFQGRGLGRSPEEYRRPARIEGRRQETDVDVRVERRLDWDDAEIVAKAQRTEDAERRALQLESRLRQLEEQLQTLVPDQRASQGAGAIQRTGTSYGLQRGVSPSGEASAYGRNVPTEIGRSNSTMFRPIEHEGRHNPQWYGCSRTGTATNIVNPIKSARLRSINSFAFKYGKIEVRAKLPAGDWLWPAIWMLPKWNQYSSWPASGEIDIMESRGNRHLANPEGVNIGVEQVASTLHWGPNPNYNRYPYTHYEKNNDTSYDSDYHNYQLDWSPQGMTFSVDGEAIGTCAPPDGGFWELGNLNQTGLDNPWKRSSKMAPFDQEFYIVLNLAVGGTSFFPDNANNPPGGKPWKNDSPKASTDFWEGREQWLPTWNAEDTHLKVDYVKVWAL